MEWKKKEEKKTLIFCDFWLLTISYYSPVGMVKPMQTWLENRETFERSFLKAQSDESKYC